MRSLSWYSLLFIFMLTSFEIINTMEEYEYSECVDTNGIFTLINAFIYKVKKTFSFRAVDPKPKVHYHLYTRLNPYQYQELIYNNSKYLEISNFNNSWPTRFIISGWLNVYNSCSSMVIKNAYLKNGNFNVITVSWDETSREINYFYLSLTIHKVAKNLAEFTRYLNITKLLPISDLYLIGFSLGAQIAGLAGRHIQLISPFKYKTIFALEPAGPMFHGVGIDGRVDSGDAEYVEAIQTNVGLAGYFGEGGKASFYPNYGTNQPHCSLRPVCSHTAAYEYFAESINSNEFIGMRCENFQKLITFNICNCHFIGKNCTKAKMGGEPATIKSGVYFLRTNNISPFALGNYYKN